MNRPEESAAPIRVEQAFAEWCADQEMVEDETAPHGEAFYAGWHRAIETVIDMSARKPLTKEDVRASRVAKSIPDMRELLSNLNHEIDNVGGREGELFEEAEETIRWLLDEYLRRGVMVDRD